MYIKCIDLNERQHEIIFIIFIRGALPYIGQNLIRDVKFPAIIEIYYNSPPPPPFNLFLQKNCWGFLDPPVVTGCGAGPGVRCIGENTQGTQQRSNPPDYHDPKTVNYPAFRAISAAPKLTGKAGGGGGRAADGTAGGKWVSGPFHWQNGAIRERCTQE